MMRDDWLLRQLEQISAAVARAFGLKKTDPVAARQILAEGWDRVFPDLPREHVDSVDLATLRTLLRTPERTEAAAALLIAEGQIHADAGDVERAGACFRLADALRHLQA